MSWNKKKIVVGAGLFTVLILVGLFVREIYFVHGQAKNIPVNVKNIFIVEQGEDFQSIGSNLQKAELIKSKLYFNIFVLFSGQYTKLQAGVYDFSGGLTVSQIAQKINRGEVKKEKITILEGWTASDIKNWLLAKDFFSETDFSFTPFEGYLFPDTYQFNFNTTFSETAQIMRQNFENKVNQDLRDEIKKQGKTLNQIIIMASLLEKEVKTYEDKQLVAGILWKRLKNDWLLQVDATLNYVLNKPSAKLSLDDLQIDSPYNTYLYKGLPIGPICNPGNESIEAAIYYKNSPYWYYLSKPTGETVFSKTFEEHKAAKAKYLR